MFTRLQPQLRLGLVGFLVLTVLTACAALPAGPAFSPLSPLATPVPATTAPGTAAPQPELPVPGATQVPQPSDRDLALTDLAAKLSISPDAITVKSLEPVEWRDASLGCPQPGMIYAQVITPGYRIVLEVDGQSYEYHTGRGSIVRCQP